MRLFLDSNIITYIAFFGGFLTSGHKEEFVGDVNSWSQQQNLKPDEKFIREIYALRILYLIDDAAHFDWICSDLGIREIQRIRDARKRRCHDDLLARMLEHRADIYAECGLRLSSADIEREASRLFFSIPGGMEDDARQFAEACIVEADFFITNDIDFIRISNLRRSRCEVTNPGKIPFVSRELETPCGKEWVRELMEKLNL